jgi:S1-C subfamily serine protease
LFRIGLVLSGLVQCGNVAAQAPSAATQSNASFVITGVVREVFQGSQPTQGNYLVQIDVQSSEARRVPATGVAVDYPGPGECVYVHVASPPRSAQRLASEATAAAIPQAGNLIRAYLAARKPAGWEGAGGDWFEIVASSPAAGRAGADAPPQAEMEEGNVLESVLKMTFERSRLKNQLALRVTSVERRGPAQQAGLEVGDTIVGVEGAPLANIEQIEAVARRGVPFSLIVADVRSGQAAQVLVTPTPLTDKPSSDSASVPATPPAAPPTSPPTAAPSRMSLGISAESVSLGLRTALKVTRVTADSPAQKAGLEPGDVIVEADGTPITGPEELISVVRKSGPTLELTVRDSRTGRDTPVTVSLGGAELPKSLPANPSADAAGVGVKQLGIVSEMAFHNDEFAVKVTEVEPSSPAARAGLKAGMLILAVNGKTVLHPVELTEALRQAGRGLRLKVVDPASGREEEIQVAL